MLLIPSASMGTTRCMSSNETIGEQLVPRGKWTQILFLIRLALFFSIVRWHLGDHPCHLGLFSRPTLWPDLCLDQRGLQLLICSFLSVTAISLQLSSTGLLPISTPQWILLNEPTDGPCSTTLEWSLIRWAAG